MAEEHWWVPGVQLWGNPDTASASLLDVRQDPTGTQVLRIYSVYVMCNAPVSAASINPQLLVLARIATSVVRGDIAPVAMKSTNTPLPSSITAGHNRSYNETGVFRQIVRILSSATIYNSGLLESPTDWMMDIPLALIWGSTKMDTNVQPVTCRAGEGFHVRQTSVIATGTNFSFALDMDMQFSVSDT